MRQRSSRPTILVIAVMLGAVAFIAQGLLPQSVNARSDSGDSVLHDVMNAFGLERARLVQLAFVDAPSGDAPDDLRISLVLDGYEHRLKLQRHSLRSPDFRILVQDASGTLEEIVPVAPSTYRGMVEGRPGSRAAVSLTPGRGIRALVTVDGDRTFAVQPVADVLSDADPTLHVLYRASDVVPLSDLRCGLPDLPHEDGFHGDDGSGMAPMDGGGPRVCEIAFDADHEFYQLNGSDAGATMADIEAVMNNVTFIYERDTNITYSIGTIVVRASEPDPYSSTDPVSLLNQFKNEWNAHQGGVSRDVAHLMTGKNMDGSVIGIAWVGVICQLTSAYGLSQSRVTTIMTYRAALTAHEIGHNWNATHCGGGDCRIMCPGIGGCSGDVTRFGGQAVSEITSFRDTRSCLGEVEIALPLPFLDTFASTGIDTGKWSDIDRATVNDSAENEPTAPYSLNLDAVGGGAQDDDRIVSRPLSLGSESRVTLSYSTQARGVEAGERLLIEFQGADGAWNPVETAVADGVDGDHFVFRHHLLPGSALHDEFRLRIRPDVNHSRDDWYVDDVSVSSSPIVVSVVPHASSVPAGEHLYFDASVSNTSGIPRSSQAWVNVVAADGRPALPGGNPRFGPVSFVLGGSKTKSKPSRRVLLPVGTPPGAGYRLIAILGDFASGRVDAVAEFPFEVTP